MEGRGGAPGQGTLASISATDKDVVAAETAWLKLFSQFNPENAEGHRVEAVLAPKAIDAFVTLTE